MLDELLEYIFNNKNLDLNNVLDLYLKVHTPFIGNKKIEITRDDWLYQLKKLPISVFTNKKKITYYMHLPGDHYIPEKKYKNKKYIDTKLNGRPVMQNVFLNDCIFEEKNDRCNLHINLNNTFTDIIRIITPFVIHNTMYKILKNRMSIEKINKNYTDYSNIKNIKGLQLLVKNKCLASDPCQVILIDNEKDLINESNYNIVFENLESYNDIIINRYLKTNQLPTINIKWNRINKTLIKNSINYMTNEYLGGFKQLANDIEDLCGSNDYSIHIIQGQLKNLDTMVFNKFIKVNNIDIDIDIQGKFKLKDTYFLKLYKYLEPKRYFKLKSLGSTNYYKFNEYKPTNLVYNIINLTTLNNERDCNEPYLKKFKSLKSNNKNVILVGINFLTGSRAYNASLAVSKIFGGKLKSFNILGKAGSINKNIKVNTIVRVNEIKLLYKHVYEKLLDIQIPEKYQIKNNININKPEYYGVNSLKYVNEACVQSVACQDINYLKKLSQQNYSVIEMEAFWSKMGLNQNILMNVLYYISDYPLDENTKISDLKEETKEHEQYSYFPMYRFIFDWIYNFETLQYKNNRIYKPNKLNNSRKSFKPNKFNKPNKTKKQYPKNKIIKTKSKKTKKNSLLLKILGLQ